eukprot:g24782.t1
MLRDLFETTLMRHNASTRSVNSRLFRVSRKCNITGPYEFIDKYFILLPADSLLKDFTAVTEPGSAATIATGVALNTATAISILHSKTIIVYDQWEDGYELDLRNPRQNTTQVWGDGDIRNGSPPRLPSDVVQTGSNLLLTEQYADARVIDSTVLRWDARDRLRTYLPRAQVGEKRSAHPRIDACRKGDRAPGQDTGTTNGQECSHEKRRRAHPKNNTRVWSGKKKDRVVEHTRKQGGAYWTRHDRNAEGADDWIQKGLDKRTQPIGSKGQLHGYHLSPDNETKRAGGSLERHKNQEEKRSSAVGLNLAYCRFLDKLVTK